MKTVIRAVEYHLPETRLTTEALAAEFPEWSARKIAQKTGIDQRHIAADDECASDLAFAAARKLFATGVCCPDDIDFLLFCTQSPDYLLPTTACLLQDRLGIPRTAGALDFNLGCSGFVYGLGLAKGLIETGQATTVLLLTADTYSRYMNAGDKSVRTIFGDAGAATLVVAGEDGGVGPVVYGTDGRGGKNLIVKGGGSRQPEPAGDIYMNGRDVFTFTVREIPPLVSRLLDACLMKLEDVDFFVFHQANRYMLDFIRERIGIPAEKFCIEMADCGNTVSSTIPIVLKRVANRLKRGDSVMLVGFGVGYSLSAAMVTWPGEFA